MFGMPRGGASGRTQTMVARFKEAMVSESVVPFRWSDEVDTERRCNLVVGVMIK